MSEEPSSANLKIKGIPEQGLWIVAIVLLIPASLFAYVWHASPPKSDEWWIPYVLSGIIFVPFVGGALYATFFCLRARIYVNNEGLRWRYVGYWHQAGWQDVTDYYIEPLPKGQQRRIVVTLSGSVNLDLFPTAVAQLEEAVQHHARHAKTQEWDRVGVRSCDEWPQTFTYNLREFRQFPFILAFMTLAMPLSMWAKTDFASPAEIIVNVQEWLPFVGWPFVILQCLTFLVIFSLYPLLILSTLPRIRVAKARQRQKIICDLQGIALQDPSQSIQVKWEEITQYYIAPLNGWIKTNNLCAVETTRGTFDFCGIERQPLLLAIIQRYATHASTSRWQALTTKTDGIVHNPSGAPFPIVHTYRTNTNRAMCWLPTGIALVISLGLWLNPDSNLPRDNIFVPAICGFVALCVWLLYYNTRLTRTETGISTSFFGYKASLSWNEIEKLDYRNGFFVVSGRNRRLYFSPLIGGARELVDEIERRAVNAQIHPSWNRITT